MKIQKLHFSKKNCLAEFHNWILENNKRALLFIQSSYNLKRINKMLNVHPVNSSGFREEDFLTFISNDLKVRISYKQIELTDGSTWFCLTSYHNINNNSIYLVPDLRDIEIAYTVEINNFF